METREKNEIHSVFVQPELSIQECRGILCRNGDEYTDEQIKEIRTLILKLVEIDFNFYHTIKREQGESKLVDLRTGQKNHNFKRAA